MAMEDRGIHMEEEDREPTGQTTTLRERWEEAKETLHEAKERLVSTLTTEVDWPWSGSVRQHIYIDFAFYVVLLVVFCVITLLPTTRRSADAYNLVQSIQRTLLEEFRPEPEIAYFSINELAGLRRWLEGQFMAVMYGYNPNTPPDDDSFTEFMPLPSYIAGFYLASTTILGPIRLRQLRVRSGSCKVEDPWRGIIESCYAPYTMTDAHIRSDDPFPVMWEQRPDIGNVSATMDTALSLQQTFKNGELTAEVLRAKNVTLRGFQFQEHTRAGIYRGRLANVYWEPGFVIDLPENNERAARTILDLMSATNWLDAQSRALFIEFSLYLAPSDLMLAVRLVAEIHETGTIWTDLSLEPVNLNVYRVRNRREIALYVVGLIVVLLAMAWDVRSTWDLRFYQERRTGSAYVWVVVGVMLYLCIIAAAILHVWNMAQASKLEFVTGEYFPTHRLGYAVTVERGLWSMASFVIWFRLLKFTSQLPQLGILGRTIGRAVPQVMVFFAISFVIFLAFAQCFFMAYYASVPGYQSYQASIMSVLRFTVLDFDYEALSAEHRILTPFLFSLLLLIVFFVWVNVMVAIISEVYQQEYTRSTGITWDEDFDSMQPGVPQPQNDLDAMAAHHPVQSCENEPPPPPVALTPDKFFRVRLAALDRFKELVTIDMHAHFSAHAAAARLRREEEAELQSALQASSTVHAAVAAAGTNVGSVPPNSRGSFFATADGQGGPEADLSAAGAQPGAARAVAEGLERDFGDSLKELEQHRGVYARLGSIAVSKAPPQGLQAYDSDGDGPQEAGFFRKRNPFSSKKPKAQPMEVVALYFERGYHNETSARMWWDKHKAFFDTREQLMMYIVTSSKRTLTKFASRLRKTRGGSNKGRGSLGSLIGASAVDAGTHEGAYRGAYVPAAPAPERSRMAARRRAGDMQERGLLHRHESEASEDDRMNRFVP